MGRDGPNRTGDDREGPGAAHRQGSRPHLTPSPVTGTGPVKAESLNIVGELSGESTRRSGRASLVPRDRIELSTPAFSGPQIVLKFQHLRVSTFCVRLPQNNNLHDGVP